MPQSDGPMATMYSGNAGGLCNRQYWLGDSPIRKKTKRQFPNVLEMEGGNGAGERRVSANVGGCRVGSNSDEFGCN